MLAPIRRALSLLIVHTLALAWLLTLPGCTSLEDLVSLRDQAADQRDRLDAHAQDVQGALEELPPGDPSRPALEADLVRTRAQADLFESDRRRLDDLITQAQSPSDPIAQAVGAIAPFVPEPARTPLVLGAALVGTLVRLHQLRRGLASVALGFEAAKRDDPDFKDRFVANAPTFRAMQTPLARRVIARAVKGA